MASNPRRRRELHRDDRHLIRSLSRRNVEVTLAGLRHFTNRSRWVGNTNRYSLDTIAKIKSDLRARYIRSPRELSQYIAASCLLHCADGWSYLGKAILSLLRGDPHRARHLAYYAELRAAISLLATEGIGIFDNKHFAVDAPNSVVRMHGGPESGTHRFAWACLDYWAKRRSSGDLFAQVVRPYGRSLHDWLSPLGGGIIVAPQAREWFRQWGMDLGVFPEDRDARHDSSYRPDGIPDLWCTDASGILTFARDLWSALEPSPTSPFDAIDRQILRIALESAFRGKTGKAAAEEQEQFKSFVLPVVDGQGLSLEVKQSWIDFVTRQASPDNLPIFAFSRQLPGTRANSELAIVSRATLLLRLASGSCSQLIASASFTLESVSFWWENLAHGRGLWDGTKEVEEIFDMWADIASSLQEVEIFQQSNSEADQTFFQIRNKLGQVLIDLSQCERVAIWGVR